MSRCRSGQPVHPAGFLIRDDITHILGILHCAAWASSRPPMPSLHILLLFTDLDTETYCMTCKAFEDMGRQQKSVYECERELLPVR
jgi:hypothetical protein